MNQNYGFVWPPGRDPFMINPEGKRMSLFVDGDIPYIRAGSSKSFAHDDAEATAILDVFMKTRTQTLFAPRRPRRLKLFQVKSMEMKKVLRMIAHLIQIRSTGRRSTCG